LLNNSLKLDVLKNKVLFCYLYHIKIHPIKKTFMNFQRLSSFSFKTLFKFTNPKGLLIGSMVSGGFLILLNEYIVYVKYFLLLRKEQTL
jgi:hypothetical protein